MTINETGTNRGDSLDFGHSLPAGLISSNEALEAAVDILLDGYREKIEGFGIKEFLKTGVDPFRFTVNVSIWGLQRSIRNEIEHKVEMALENMIGDFHENYLGNSIHKPSGTKWAKVPEGDIGGVDIANYEQKIFLQVKSKHNSMNSSSSKRLAQELAKTAQERPGATVGCAWVVGRQKKKAIGEKTIAEVGACYKGKKVYEVVTGEPDEMDNVLAALLKLIPQKLADISFDELLDKAADSVAKELTFLAESAHKTPIQIVTERSID